MKTCATTTARRNENGAALLIAMLILSVLLLVGGAFLGGSLIEKTIAANVSNSAAAFGIAEAGVEHGRGVLPGTDVDALLTAGGNMFTGQGLSGGSYTVDARNNVAPTFPRGTVPADPGGANDDTDTYLVLRSTGSFGTAERTIEVVVERELVPLPYGLYGIDLLRLGGSGVTTADVGTNGDIEFTGGSPAVIGDADASGTVTDPSYVTGTSTDGAPPQSFPAIPCPTTAFGGVPAGPGVSFNAATGDLDLTGGGNKTYPGGTYYYRDFRKAGSGEMHLVAGQRVDIFVGGELSITGGGFVNPNNSAEFLQIWACGADSSGWSFSGNDEVWLTIYAPGHDLVMTGSGDKHGSFIADEVRTSGSADYYFDAGLSLPTDRYVTVPGTWSERVF